MWPKDTTSWDRSSRWYNRVVGDRGHYYHRKIIMPGVMRMANIKGGERVLDLACGNGVLARNLPAGGDYLGIDLSAMLIDEARKKGGIFGARFEIGDVTKKSALIEKDRFDLAFLILAMQNLNDPFGAVKNAYFGLKSGGRFVIVLNHPCFRVLRHSGWGVDSESKRQYRWVDAYFKEMKVAVLTNPGRGEKSEKTWSFHYNLSEIFRFVIEGGFEILGIEEWVSDKKSEGGRARMEDRAREEIPLFMAILAKKKN